MNNFTIPFLTEIRDDFYFQKKTSETTGNIYLKDFIEQNGCLNFENATINGKPFSGKIKSGAKAFEIESHYNEEGSKDMVSFKFVNLYSAGNGRNSGDLRYDHTENLEDGRKNVIYSHPQGAANYVETYLQDGRLEKTTATLKAYKMSKENRDYWNGQTQREYLQDKNFLVTTTLYDKKGLYPVKEESVLQSDHARISRRIINYNENGELISQTTCDNKNLFKTEMSDKRVITFDEHSNPKRIKDTNCKYYVTEARRTPYAASKKKIYKPECTLDDSG